MAQADVGPFDGELLQKAQNGAARLFVAVAAQVGLLLLGRGCRARQAGGLVLLKTGPEGLVKNLPGGREFQVIPAVDPFPVDQRLEAFVPIVAELFPRLAGVGLGERHEQAAGAQPEGEIERHRHGRKGNDGVEALVLVVHRDAERLAHEHGDGDLRLVTAGGVDGAIVGSGFAHALAEQLGQVAQAAGAKTSSGPGRSTPPPGGAAPASHPR